jgi:PBP1b-binding outer membrane lipoprotein LpoB
MKRYAVIAASIAVLFLSGCFYSHTVKEYPAQPAVTAPPPGQTTSQTTTTKDNGTVQRRTTTTYSNY